MPTDKQLLERVNGIGDTLARRLLSQYGEGSEVARIADSRFDQLNVSGISERQERAFADQLRRAGVFNDLRNGNYTPFIGEADIIRAGGSGHFMETPPEPAEEVGGWREPTTGLFTGYQLDEPNISRESESGRFVDTGPEEEIDTFEQSDRFGIIPDVVDDRRPEQEQRELFGYLP